MEEKINKSETRIFKAVFPNTTNHYDTLFGGTAMALMDEAAFITATRFARKKVVTVSSDKIRFHQTHSLRHADRTHRPGRQCRKDQY